MDTNKSYVEINKLWGKNMKVNEPYGNIAIMRKKSGVEKIRVMTIKESWEKT